MTASRSFETQAKSWEDAPRAYSADDGDFCTVPDITVFTANRSMLSAARR